MLIIGDKYRFTEADKKILKKYNLKITFLSMETSSKKQVNIQLRESAINQEIIVLNTPKHISNILIKIVEDIYPSSIQCLKVETLLERYLNKCYIPEVATTYHSILEIQPYSTSQYIQKRIIDYIGFFLIYLIMLPLMIYSRIRVKKESPGTAIYRQNRVGLHGKEFNCIKFRSMELDAEKEGASFAQEDDSRIFAWGKKMRKMHIDELPQLLNVIRGEMHLVGPRPERKVWIEIFEKNIPSYHKRHIVRPGITGWAQVMSFDEKNGIDVQQKLMYDLYYIKHWSLYFDVKILWQTLIGILVQR